MSLQASAEPLCRRYDVALLDLDGVVYLGPVAVVWAAESLAAARAGGMRLGFVTNNASRPPELVAEQLLSLGIPAGPDEVVTSAQAVATLLADRLPAGAPVLVTGGSGLREAIVAAGLRLVDDADAHPAAVAQGYGPDLRYRDLAEAALAIRAGAFWVAANLDATMPSPRGQVPGNGALVAAVRAATGAVPVSVGKPERSLHDEAVRRIGAVRPLVVGDRLDTDVEGAIRVGCDSLLVLTGVTDVAAVAAAPEARRPTYLGSDLRALLVPHPQPVTEVDGGVRCGGWLAAVVAGSVRIEGSGPVDDALRAAVTLAWQVSDGGSELHGLPEAVARVTSGR